MEVKQIGNCMVSGKRDNPNPGRVYDSSELSPCLTDMQGGGRQPHVVEVKKMGDKKIKIRQATKNGFIDCEIGGGGGFGLSNISNTQRSSTGERTDLPDFDNGEYP